MAAAAAGGGASAHEPSGDNVDGGAQWFVGINDAGMPLFSWATGMPMPARVVWNIVTGLATAAGSADHRLERVCCDHCALLMDTYSHGEDSVVTAALHSTRPTNLTSPAHAGALRPPDVRALYEVVQMLVGSRALNSSNADKLKLIVRVCTGAWLPSTTPHPKLVRRERRWPLDRCCMPLVSSGGPKQISLSPQCNFCRMRKRHTSCVALCLQSLGPHGLPWSAAAFCTQHPRSGRLRRSLCTPKCFTY